MLSLFSTGSDASGFRLQYMEIYNWGTFHEKIFRLDPQGNNALLTGANASGKSTIIDALLTLMVPAKKDRFYNQSSGVEKKGNRTEETYVLGHYGNIQKEGERGTSTQALRDQSAYSVLLASFSNADQQTVTVFQVRWFSGGELRRTFGLAHCALEIQRDFQPFDGKGIWRRRLEKEYKGNRTMVEFFDGPVGYADRMTQLFGMRSTKALGLFNQIVGVKVLDDLDEFIRTNMLEEHNAESKYILLKDSFKTLMDAKTNIEKSRQQIELLTPIAELAEKIQDADARLKQLEIDRETAEYWFARKTIELGKERIEKAEKDCKKMEADRMKLREKEEDLRAEERSLSLAIENDEVGRKIKDILQDAKHLEKIRDERMKRMDEYNRIARQLAFSTDPTEEVFVQQRETAQQKVQSLDEEKEEQIRQTVSLENERKQIAGKIEEQLHSVDSVKKNRNNIPVRELEIREMILAETGATKEEIPFIGELVRVNEEEQQWEGAVEKILHHFALHLLVPEKYYREVNRFINDTDLKGRITYYRYLTYNSLSGMDCFEDMGNRLLGKIEIRPDSPYEEWARDMIYEKYNYACVDSLEEFERYSEKAVTAEGLVKFSNERHEKDDRPHIIRKENYILGWDNQEKMRLLQSEVRKLQEHDVELLNQLNALGVEKQKMLQRYELYHQLIDQFTDYDQVNWSEYAERLQEKLNGKAELEENNDRIHTLQKQLEGVKESLRQLNQVDIEQKSRSIYGLENRIEETQRDLDACQQKIATQKHVLLTDFEKAYEELQGLEYEQLKQEHDAFLARNNNLRSKLGKEKGNYENSAKTKIRAFKYPVEYITDKFKDWRSDVDALPEDSNVELIGEYQLLLARLQKENLPKYEKQFDNYLQKTLTDKVGEFRMFFMHWKDAIDENIKMLNESLQGIDYRPQPATYIQLVTQNRINEEISEFRRLIDKAMPETQADLMEGEARRIHFRDHIEPFMNRLADEEWRKRVMDVRSWFTYRAEEFNRETGLKENTYENMGHLSGGEKAQLTYTILGSAIAYQFGLTKSGQQENSFRFIAIDEAFKAQDEDKARYLINLCKKLHLQLLVVTPNDNIHIVENDISFVYFVERKEEKTSWMYSMTIEQWKGEKSPDRLF